MLLSVHAYVCGPPFSGGCGMLWMCCGETQSHPATPLHKALLGANIQSSLSGSSDFQVLEGAGRRRPDLHGEHPCKLHGDPMAHWVLGMTGLAAGPKPFSGTVGSIRR